MKAARGVIRVLRWTLYVTIFFVISALSLSEGPWPRGGPDTPQARDVANLLLAVLGVVGVALTAIYFTAPRAPS